MHVSKQTEHYPNRNQDAEERQMPHCRSSDQGAYDETNERLYCFGELCVGVVEFICCYLEFLAFGGFLITERGEINHPILRQPEVDGVTEMATDDNHGGCHHGCRGTVGDALLGGHVMDAHGT
jgi:hypothetical protein